MQMRKVIHMAKFVWIHAMPPNYEPVYTGETQCGLNLPEDRCAGRWEKVTCKRCLRRKPDEK